MHFGGVVLTPRAGLRWAYVHGQGFMESGGGGQDLTVGADNARSVQPYAGLSLSHDFGSAERPKQVHLDVTYANELAGRTRAVTVFAQDGTAFSAPGAPLAREIVSIGAGLRAQLSRAWSVSADASTQFRSGSALQLQMSYRY
jgi:outer membrane autotransporter protein